MATLLDFDNAFNFTCSQEGNYDTAYSDRGNWTSGVVGVGELKGTKYGISAMSYPNIDIANLTLGQAKSIYLSDFWNASNCQFFPKAIAIAVFDSAVNQGSKIAIKFIQEAINATPVDGDFGTESQSAFTNALAILGEGGILAAFMAARQQGYTEDSEWLIDGKGWIRRTAHYILQWKDGLLNESKSK